MLATVAETISRYNMLPEPGRVGVGVSGGADSVALLHALAALGPRWRATPVVLHLNHCLRGQESDGDERFVRELAQRLGLECAVESVPVGDMPGNLEENARRVRYAFFDRAAAALRLDRIATAHTRGDQSETVLFRLLRGTGPSGLAAIRPVAGRVVRPLIGCTRAQVEDYLREIGETWREDRSNTDTSFARNRIRHAVLPSLRQESPAVEEHFARLAALAATDEEYWEAEVAGMFPRVARPWLDGWVLDAAALRDLHWALASRVLRAAIARLAPAVDAAHVETIRRMLDSDTGGSHATLPGLRVVRSFDSLLLAPPGTSPKPYQYAVRPPASIATPGWRVTLRTAAPGRPPLSRYNTGGVRCDYVTAPDRLELRNWRPGDAYRPEGSSRRKKLKELFHRARVPSWERPGWPMITLGSDIVWALGFGPSAGSYGGRMIEVRVSPLSIGEPFALLRASEGM